MISILAASLLLAAPAGKSYPDGHGGTVAFPLGDLSFADEVVSSNSGRPVTRKGFDPARSLAAPDYDAKSGNGTYTLGCGGSLVVRFVDNAVVDLPGPDLFVFEVGPQIEPTELSLSTDGLTWVAVGKIEGGRADVDLSGVAKPGDVFHLVKLTDLKKGCSGTHPGADIDAVGAIGSGVAISLRASVLFATGESVLKPEAKADLEGAAAKIREYPGAQVVIAGHTDSVGTAAANQKLSEARAAAVRAHLQKTSGLEAVPFKTAGHGATRPAATNDTPEGREKNRRVEIVVVPAPAK